MGPVTINSIGEAQQRRENRREASAGLCIANHLLLVDYVFLFVVV